MKTVTEEILGLLKEQLEGARRQKELAEGLERWAESLCLKAKEEATVRTAQSSVKVDKVRAIKLRIDQWRTSLI